MSSVFSYFNVNDYKVATRLQCDGLKFNKLYEIRRKKDFALVSIPLAQWIEEVVKGMSQGKDYFFSAWDESSEAKTVKDAVKSILNTSLSKKESREIGCLHIEQVGSGITNEDL